MFGLSNYSWNLVGTWVVGRLVPACKGKEYGKKMPIRK